MGAPQQADDLSFRWIAIAIAIVTTLSAIYVLMAWALDSAGPPAPPSPWPQIPEEINEIEVARFDETTAAEHSVAPEHKHLESYGWTDRDKAVIHIPIETAIEIYLDRSQQESP